MQTNASVGEKIRDLRKKLKLTQSELAGKDFTKSFISQVEKGQTNPSLKSLRIIAGRLGIPVSYLLEKEAEPSQSREYLVLLEQARFARKQGHLNEAIELYIRAADSCTENDHAAIGFIHMLLAETRADQGTLERAKSDLELAVEHLRLSHDRYNLARAYNLLGHFRATSQSYQDALSAFMSGLTLFEDGQINDRHLELLMKVNIGITLSNLERHNESIDFLESSIEMMKSHDNYITFGKVCHTLGYSYAELGEIDRAITFTRQAVDLYTSLNQWELAVSSQINLGIYLHQSGNMTGARSAFSILVRGDWPTSLDQKARAHVGLAEVALDEGRISDAYQHLLEAFTIAPTYPGASEWTSIVVDCAEKAPVPPELLTMVERLPSKWKGEPRGLAEIHSNLGKLYRLMGDTEKANQQLSKSVDLYKNA